MLAHGGSESASVVYLPSRDRKGAVEGIPLAAEPS